MAKRESSKQVWISGEILKLLENRQQKDGFRGSLTSYIETVLLGYGTYKTELFWREELVRISSRMRKMQDEIDDLRVRKGPGVVTAVEYDGPLEEEKKVEHKRPHSK